MASDLEARLQTVERIALAAGRLVNGPIVSKALQYPFVRRLSYGWMYPSMSRRTYADNIDWLVPPPSDRGVLFACNHRSFFDSYLYLFSLYNAGAKWPRNLCFPVRSEFFYDRPMGIAVNFAIGGGVMYPPIYRDKEKRALNEAAIDHVCDVLDRPNSMVGLHPEGKRNQGDPYKLLPAQPGIGQIVLRAKPLVVPIFVNGLNNDFVDSVRTSFKLNAKRDHSLIVTFGDPVDYDEFTNSKPRAALYKKCADKIHKAIASCGQREKDLRGKIERGEIRADDPQWLSNRN
ncbi:MAG: 1-acyl-sn-glycerol-3-phosphate acyltransferase [Myxococcales bacterium]|nr:1-acyl-sn-glycerol-3-phosphate acyltransferase [Myxococcales bacterium]